MRNKDHHLQLRGRKYYIRYDIPTDLRDCFPSRGRTVYEALGTGDKIEARKRRDRRLRELDQEWYRLRQAKRRSSARATSQALDGNETGDATSLESWALQVSNSDDPEDHATFSHLVTDMLDRLAEPRVRRRGNHHDYIRATEEAKQTPEGQRLTAALQIAEGKATPISEVAEEWLRSRGHLNASSLSTYRKALRVLQERFLTVEEVTRRAARNYLSDLLQGLNKRTVGQYLIPYRGVWDHADKDTSIWSTKGMDGPIKSIPILSWNDDEYLRLLAAAEAKGFRDMWLAVRIAAHTGGAAQGIASLEVIDEDQGRSLYLTETKKEWRSRKIPCHPEIFNDVVEWQNKHRHTSISLSRKFGRLKSSLGYGRKKVLHSFRHSLAHKLENARLPTREIKRLLGHHIPDITFGTYNAEGLNYEVLSAVITKLRWPSIE